MLLPSHDSMMLEVSRVDASTVSQQPAPFRVQLALAIALARARSASSRSRGEDDELNRWKKKAKLLEQEIQSITEDLQQIQGASVWDKLPPLPSCKCLFLGPQRDQVFSLENETEESWDDDFSQASIQGFLRNVRIIMRASKQDSNQKIIDDKSLGQLTMVVDFVGDLCCKIDPLNSNLKYVEAYTHQAVEFIKDAVPWILKGSSEEQSHGGYIVNKLILELLGKMLTFNSETDSDNALDHRVWCQQILMKLSVLPYIGQRVLLLTSRQIVQVLERLMFMEPFDDGVSQTYENLFFLFQLVERLLEELLFTSWAKDTDNGFDHGLLEEWVMCHFKATAALQQTSNWISRVMDRITAKVIEYLHRTGAPSGQLQDSWHLALMHLVKSASSTVACPGL
ncbi:hypothetical protein BDL97_03G041700 [Sphagnum fallax]|nr:hypothetical protein BDL97_03G041700 [Sphagnum fallax]